MLESATQLETTLLNNTYSHVKVNKENKNLTYKKKLTKEYFLQSRPS